MTHKMKLSPTAFKSISTGQKTVEMRLFDENPRDMYAYYAPETIEKYGVLAIEIRVK